MKNSLCCIHNISFSLQSTAPAILGGIVKGLKGGKMVQSGDSTATPKSTFDHLEGMFWRSQQSDSAPGLDHQENLELDIGLVLIYLDLSPPFFHLPVDSSLFWVNVSLLN